jgi:hypothetical protein
VAANNEAVHGSVVRFAPGNIDTLAAQSEWIVP